MIRKYSKINNLLYIKNKLKVKKFNLKHQNYSGFWEVDEKQRENLSMEYELLALHYLKLANKKQKVYKYINHFRCVKCLKLRNKKESYEQKGCRCKPCHKTWRREDYQSNKVYQLKRQKKYNRKNKDKYLNAIKNAVAKNPEYYKKMMSKYHKERRKNDPIFKLCLNIRGRTRDIFKSKNWVKNKHFKDYIGCTPQELGLHIEKQFTKRMNWSNHGTYWELDHIIPIGLAKTKEDVYKLNHYTNLQPLSIKKHKSKTKKDIKRIRKNETNCNMYL